MMQTLCCLPAAPEDDARPDGEAAATRPGFALAANLSYLRAEVEHQF